MCVWREPDVSEEQSVASIFTIEQFSLSLAFAAGFFHGLLFNCENENDLLLRNVDVSPDYTALQHRTQSSL